MRTWYYARYGKQSGPVGIEELRRLVGTGSLDVTDLVWKEGMAEWLPASEIPELQEILRPHVSPPPIPMGSDNPYAPPAWEPQTYRSVYQDPSTPFVPGSEPMPVEAVAKHTLELTKKYWSIIFLAALIYVGITGPANFAVAILAGVSGPATSAANISITLFGGVLVDLISWFLMSGLSCMLLELAAGRPAPLQLLFSQGSKFGKIAGAHFIYLIPMWIYQIYSVVCLAGHESDPGLALSPRFLLPVVVLMAVMTYLNLRFGQFLYAIIEKDMGIMESFRYSSEITLGSRANLFVLSLLSAAVLIMGVLLLFVGLLFAAPYVLMLQIVAYRWLSRGSRSLVQEG